MAEINDIFELKVTFCSKNAGSSHKQTLILWLNEKKLAYVEDYVDGLDGHSLNPNYDAQKIALPLTIYAESFSELESIESQIQKELTLDLQFEHSKIEAEAWSQSWRENDFWVETDRFYLGNTSPSQKSKEKYWIEMPDGKAFGNGQHATTESCLRSIEHLDFNERFQRVLDIGTGTGVLAIAAGLLGCQSIHATEIDGSLLNEALENAQKHSVDIVGNVTPSLKDYPSQNFHLVIANILVPVLHELSSDIVRVLAPKGYVILSGFIEKEAKGICEKFERHGLKEISRINTRGWLSITLAE